MSAEQVAGILRQCSQQVTLVVARSIREPTTTADETMQTSPLISLSTQRASITSESLSKTINSNPSLLTTAQLLSSIGTDNDGIIPNSQNKVLLRTERLLENNQHLEKLLENLREQVPSFFFLSFFLSFLLSFPSLLIL